MISKIIVLALVALVAVNQVNATAPATITVLELFDDGVCLVSDAFGGTAAAITSATIRFPWAEYTDAENCITSTTSAAIPDTCRFYVYAYQGAAAYTGKDATSTVLTNTNANHNCKVDGTNVECALTTSGGGATAKSAMCIRGQLRKSAQVLTVANWKYKNNVDTDFGNPSAKTFLTHMTVAVVNMPTHVGQQSQEKIKFTITSSAFTVSKKVFIRWAGGDTTTQITNVDPTLTNFGGSPTFAKTDYAANTLPVIPTYAATTIALTATANSANPTIEYPLTALFKAGATAGTYKIAVTVEDDTTGVPTFVGAVSYTLAALPTDYSAKINVVGAGTLGAYNTDFSGTGVFSFTLNNAVPAAAATKFNTISLVPSDGTNSIFEAGTGKSVCSLKVDGVASTAYTTSTTLGNDIATAKVVMRSAAAGGALASGAKLEISCTKMKYLSAVNSSATMTLAIKTTTDSATASAGVEGLYFHSSKAITLASGGQAVGKSDSSVKVFTKATGATTAVAGVIGAVLTTDSEVAAVSGVWVNKATNQYLQINATGLGAAVTAGTDKIITVTFPATWAVDNGTTGAKVMSTIKVAGADVTANYTVGATTTTVTFTPSAAANGAIAEGADVSLLIGGVVRSGAVAASRESVTVTTSASSAVVHSGTFHLPLCNSLGGQASSMSVVLSSKSLSGSVTGFEDTLTAGSSNTAVVTPDTTYTFTTVANDCTGSMPAGKNFASSAQTATAATLTFKSDAAYSSAADKLAATLAFTCKLATVPTTFVADKTVKVTRGTNESGFFKLSQGSAGSAASASSTVGVVLGAVFGVVGLAQLTL